MFFADWLKGERERREQSQASAARAAGVSRATWSRWEAGRHGVGVHGARRLAAWAGVEVGAVLSLA